jgi:hypothetical protein
LRSDLHKWLSPPDPWKNYNVARESRHEATGAWFVNGTTLSKWKESGPSSLLWIHGKRQYRSALTSTYSFAKTNNFTFEAGSGKSVIWYVNPLIFSSRNLRQRLVLQSSRTLRTFVRPAVHRWRCITMTSGRTKRETSVGCSHRFCSNFVTNPTCTTISFSLSIRHTAMVNKAPATTIWSGV